MSIPPFAGMPAIIETTTAVYHANGLWFIITEVKPDEISIGTSGEEAGDVVARHSVRMKQELEPILQRLVNTKPAE